MKSILTNPSVLLFTFALGVAAVFGVYSLIGRKAPETVKAPIMYKAENGGDIAAIYSEIFREEGYRVSEVLINDRTASDFIFEGMAKDRVIAVGTPDMFASYLDNNRERTHINEYFADRPQVVFWTKEMSEATFGENVPESWKVFHSQHPGIKGIVTFSGVGFNAAGDRALVFFKYSANPLDALGTFFDMQKASDGTWYVLYKKDLWAA